MVRAKDKLLESAVPTREALLDRDAPAFHLHALEGRRWAILETLKTALQAHLRPGIGLWDPEQGAPTPPDHYGQLGTSLALLVLEGSNQDTWRLPMDAWLDLPNNQLGHLPFNRFLLLLIHDVLRSSGAHSEGYTNILRKGLARCPMNQRYPSNNWRLLGALCQLIEASPKMRQRRIESFCVLIDRWTTPLGGFIDYPRQPAKMGATPITYHFKALFLAVVAAWFEDDPALTPRIQRLWNWTSLCLDETGYVAGFGRSTHSLFADGCLLASLILLGFAGDNKRTGPAQPIVDRILARLQAQKRPDGFYWLNPAGDAAGTSGWDDYMRLSVYNAWFAAVVAWALQRVWSRIPPQCVTDTCYLDPADVQNPLAVRDIMSNSDVALLSDDAAGIIRISSVSGLNLSVSSRGQPPQAFGRSAVELRYAGGIPFQGRIGDQLVIPPSSRLPLWRLLDCPALAGWTPVFQIRDQVYGLTDFDEVNWRETKVGVAIALRGVLTALVRRGTAGALNRVLGALDWRILHGAWSRHEALRRERVDSIRGSLVLSVSTDRPALTMEWMIENDSPAQVTYLNPVGHALVTDSSPRRWELEYSNTPNSQIAMQRVTRPDAMVSGSLVGAIAHASGYCLPGMRLHEGKYQFRLYLEW